MKFKPFIAPEHLHYVRWTKGQHTVLWFMLGAKPKIMLDKVFVNDIPIEETHVYLEYKSL